MNEVIRLNGIPVYSDKSIQSIDGTRVTFSDGSWCDVATGEVVNKGSRYMGSGLRSSILFSKEKRGSGTILDLKRHSSPFFSYRIRSF